MPELGTAQDLKQAGDNFVMKYDNGSIWIKKNSEIIHFVDSKLEVICKTSWLLRWGTNFNDYATKNKFNPLPYVVQVSKRKKNKWGTNEEDKCKYSGGARHFWRHGCCLPYVHSILLQL